MSEWLGNLINIGGSLYDAYNRGQARDNYGDLLRGIEDRNFADAQREHDAYMQYLDSVDGVRGANARGAAAGNAAHIAGAQQAEFARLGALKKGMKKQRKQYKRAQKMLKPYQKAGARTLPIAEQSYKNGMEGANALFAYMMSPQRMQRLERSGPATAMNIGQLPDYLRNKDK